MAVTDTDQLLIDELRARHLRVTSQRLMIHRTVRERPTHMTAEQVLESVSEVLPGTSLPTVYATLELLAELGLVRRVATGSGPTLFDSRLEPHAHTVCRRCGATMDLDASPIPPQTLAQASHGGFVPEHAELVVWGRCRTCAAQD